MSIRLFVGLPLPALLRDRLSLLSGGIPGARWVSPENLHLTLRFIGSISEERAREVDDALMGIDHPTFDVMPEGVGHFGEPTVNRTSQRPFQPSGTVAW